VAAEARAGIERHETEGFSGGGFDNFPDINVHAGGEELEFVDERDVDATKNVFQELGHFRGPSRADGNDFGDDLGVESLRGARARRIGAAHDFGNLREAVLLVAGIFALWGEGEKKVGGNVVALDAGGDGAAQSRSFENWKDEFFGGARVSGGFKDNELALLQIRLDGDGSLLDETEIRLAAFVERSRDANEDGVNVLEALEIGGGIKVAAVHELLNFVLANVLDVGFARIEHGDFSGIGVKTGDLLACFREAKG
jgi:hypothetical protein